MANDMSFFGKKLWAGVSGVAGFLAVVIITTNIENWAEKVGANKIWQLLPGGSWPIVRDTLPYVIGFGIGAVIFGYWDTVSSWWTTWFNRIVHVETLRAREKKLEDIASKLMLANRDVSRLRVAIPEALAANDTSDIRIAELLRQWWDALSAIDACAVSAFPYEGVPDVALDQLYIPSRCPLVFPPRFTDERRQSLRKYWDQDSRVDYILPDLIRRVGSALEEVRADLRQNGVPR